LALKALKRWIMSAKEEKTYRASAVDALRSSEARFRAVVENSHDGIIFTDAESRILYRSPSYNRINGFTDEDRIGRSGFEIVHPDDVEDIRRQWAELIKHPEAAFKAEYRIRHKDGTWRWIESRGSNLLADPNVRAVVVSSRDITESRQAEIDRQAAAAARQASEARFRAVVENSYDGILFTDADAKILYRSPSFPLITGYTDEESVGRSGFAKMHPDDISAVRGQWEAMIRNPGFLLRMEYRIRHKDGSWRWIETAAKNLLGNKDIGAVVVTSRDITERKRAEEALQDSEERYRQVVELSPDAVMVHRKGTIAFANASAATLFGASTPADLVGTGIDRIVHPDFRQIVQARARVIQEQGKPVPRQEQKCLRLDGTPFDIEVSSTPIIWNGERSSLTMIRDISERKRTEEALDARGRELRTLLAAAERHAKELELLDQVRRSVSGGLELPVIFRSVVESIAVVFGYSLVSLYVQREDGFLTLQHQVGYARVPERVPVSRGVMGRVFRSGIPELVKDVHADKDYLETDGAVVSEICIPLRDQGRPVGVLIVESAKQAPMAEADVRIIEAVGEEVNIAFSKAGLYADAQANARRYRDLVATLGEGVAVVDLKERFEFANPAAETVFGLPAGKLLGRTLSEFLSPADFARVEAETRKRLRGESGAYEMTIRRLDGEARQIEVIATPYRAENGEVTGSLAVFRDVSDLRRMEHERRELQEQLQQSQKMEAVGRLAGGVAHDFNNLLQVIVGYAEVALQSLTPETRLHSELQQILKAAHRSADLTRQLLTFARKQEVAPQVLNLNQRISGTLTMLQRLIGEDIRLLWEPEPNLWPVKVDPTQIDQILANLAANSRDAIAGIGTLTVTTSNATVDEEWCRTHVGWIPGEYAVVQIRDTGKGIPPEVLEHVFEPFFTTKGVGRGTGLGLATVYGIVKQSNGFIDVASKVGAGATFRLYFPRAEAPAAGDHVEAEKTIPSGSETVLVVEDDENILGLIRGILERLGYHLLAARTPGQALAIARQHGGPVALLVTDVVMPEMNGRELQRQVSALLPGIKTLFMSGYTADVISRRGVEDEGGLFLQKPFTITDIAQKVRRVLDQR
jgi:PAS domain S-box-containing protein